MPMIELAYPEGLLSREERVYAVERLCEALLRHAGAADNQRSRALSWQYVHEVPSDAVYVGGAPAGRPLYRVRITVPSGTLLHGPGAAATTAREKLIGEVTAILLDADGSPTAPEEAWRVRVLIAEVPDGFWGGLGVPFSMRDIAAFVDDEQGGAAHVKAARAVAPDFYPPAVDAAGRPRPIRG